MVSMKRVTMGAVLCLSTLLVMSPAQATDRDGFNRYTSTNPQSVTTVQSDQVLQAGSIIPATLVTRLTSDNMSSVIVATVRQNVYDSVTGTNILIPAGSRLIGEPMQLQGSRINISFERIIFPNGHSIQLPNYEATDGIGTSGLKDKYTTHAWLKTRSVLTGAIFAGVTGLADKSNRTSNSSTNSDNRRDNALSDAIASLIDGLNDIAKQDASQIKPTGTIREGYQFNVILHTDIQLRPYGPRR